MEEAKKGKAPARVVMPEADKKRVREGLLNNFANWGVDRDLARKAVDAGHCPMWLWVCRWIGRNTAYGSDRALTVERFRAGFYAWIHYKATAEEPSAVALEEA